MEPPAGPLLAMFLWLVVAALLLCRREVFMSPNTLTSSPPLVSALLQLWVSISILLIIQLQILPAC